MKLFHWIAGAAFAAGMAGGASYAQADALFYGGLGGTLTTYDEDVTVGGVTNTFKDSVAGVGLFVGFESWLPNTRGLSVGGELSVNWHDTFEDDLFGNRSELDLLSADLLGKFYVPIDKAGVFRVNVQGGLHFADTEFKSNGAKIADDTDTNLQLGGGFDLRVAPGVRLGVDARYIFLDDTDFFTTGLRGLFYF